MSESEGRAHWPAILIGATFCVVALLTAALLALDSAPVRAYVRQHVVQLLSASLNADVAIGDVSQLGLGRASLQDVSIRQADKQILAAKELSLDASLEGFIPPRIRLRGELIEPALDLARDEDGQWNVVRLFGGDAETPDDGSESPIPAFLAQVDFVLRGGAVRIAGFSSPLTGLSACGALTNALHEAPRLIVDDLRVKVGEASHATAELALELTGPGELAGKIELAPLVARDFGGLVPALRPGTEARGKIVLAGTLDRPAAEIELESGSAALRARVHLSDDARVSASARIDAFDPAAVLVDAPPGDLTAEGEVTLTLPSFSESGFPTDLVASLSVFESTLAGVDLEHLTAHINPDGGTLQLEIEGATRRGGVLARLDAAIGVRPPHAVKVEGEIRLDDSSGLPGDLEALLAETQLVAAVQAEVADVTADPVGHLALTVGPGRLRGLEIRDAELRASVDESTLRVEKLALGAGRGRLAGEGEVGLGRGGGAETLRATVVGSLDLAIVSGIEGLVDVDLAVEGSTADLAARLHAASKGALELPGVASTLDARIEVHGLGSDQASGKMALTGRLAPRAATERVLGADEIPARMDATWTRSAGLDGRATDRLEIDGSAGSVGAADTAGQRWAATVERSAEKTSIELEQLLVHLPHGRTWELDAPARIVVDAKAVVVGALRFGAGDSGLTAGGRIARAPGVASDLHLAVDQLDLEPFCVFAFSWAGCSGRLDAGITLTGTVTGPDLRADLSASALEIGGQRYGEASLALRTPGSDRLTVEGGVGGGKAGTLRLRADLPLAQGDSLPEISWAGPAEVDLRLSDLQVDALRTLTGPTISRLDGQAAGELALRGSLADPRLSGVLEVDDLEIGMAAAGGVHRDGRIRISLAQDRITLDQLVLDEGAISGSGVVDLGESGAGALDLSLALRGAKLVDRPEVAARVTGDLALSGALDEPALTGELSVDSATIRPSLAARSFERDPSIQVVRSNAAAPAWISGVPPEMAGALVRIESGKDAGEAPVVPPPGFYDLLSMMIKVRLGDAVAVNRFDAHLRLTGEVQVAKVPYDPIRITGQIGGRNGWYIFQGRRLEIERARVTFNGDVPIYPYLDVEAQYRAPDYLVIGRVSGTAKHPSLDLSSEPPLDESDVLAVLLFGKPASQLNSTQGQVLQQQALALLASYVAPELQRSVLDSVGLTSLTFSMPTGDTAGTLGVGRYFGDDIFVSLAQDFGGPKGGTQRQLQGLIGTSVTIQYFLTPSITVQGASSTEGETSVDAIWQRRY